MKKLLLSIALIIIPVALFGQEDIPPEYVEYLNEKTLLAVAAVVGFTKMFKNLLPIGGIAAVIVTVVVSLVYAMIQYGIGDGGMIHGAIIGLLAAGSFFLTKKVGKLHNKTGEKFHLSSLKK